MEDGNVWAGKRGASEVQDKTIIERIMLRYRPIAPKPVAGGSSAGYATVVNCAELVSNSRKKRKYVRVKQTRKCRTGKEKKDKDGNLGQDIVDLQLDCGFKGFTEGGSSVNLDFTAKQVPFWMSFNKSENNGFIFAGEVPDQADRKPVMKPVGEIETWVIVDGITDTWIDSKGLGSTDMEKMKNLEMDNCPGLISDGFKRVKWMNLAYRRLVDPFNDIDSSAQVVVRLVVKGKLPAVLGEAFACTVRVVYTLLKVKHSKTMPCDVWKMDFGGFAWRLDSKAALTLGR